MAREAKQITLIFQYGDLRFEAVVVGDRTSKGDWVYMYITNSPRARFSFFDASRIFRVGFFKRAKSPENLANEIIDHCKRHSPKFVDNVTAETFADVLTLVKSAGER